MDDGLGEFYHLRGAQVPYNSHTKVFRELKRGSNTEIGTKDFFEMASKRV